ncbi:hypothetical protein BJV82DRAFT_656328 [Fennellomyces sp. T-0311]|nr:hypothetical protein BJV82DRAFT_656328 [Fennellomyces sp. T-0311]
MSSLTKTKAKPSKKQTLSQETEKENQATKPSEAAPTFDIADISPTTIRGKKYKRDDWYPIRHPKLPISPSPNCFVNKLGSVCMVISGQIARVKIHLGIIPGHILGIHDDTTKFRGVKLGEVMAHTFIEEFDNNIHYIVYKNGAPSKCNLPNILFFDLKGLQEYYICKLQKSNPGSKFTVVKNLHDTLTFRHYLISDQGRLFSLVKQVIVRYHTDKGKDEEDQCLRVGLWSDEDGDTPSQHITFAVRSIVLQSFGKRLPDNAKIRHANGRIGDCSLDNLIVVAKDHIDCQPSSESNDGEVEWRPIGVLPWNKLSFSQYEVSNMGGVREVVTHTPVNFKHSRYARKSVYLISDQEEVSYDGRFCVRARRVNHEYVGRLVANAFVVPGYDKDTRTRLLHLNRNCRDDRAENLKWVNKSVSITGHPVMVRFPDYPTESKVYPTKKAAECDLYISLSTVYKGDTVQRTCRPPRYKKQREGIVHIP